MVLAPWRRLLAMCVLAVPGGTTAGSQEVDSAQTQFYQTSWRVRDGAPAGLVALAQTTDGYLWLGAETGLFRFDGVTFHRFQPTAARSVGAFSSSTRHTRQSAGGYLLSSNVEALLATADGALWIGYNYGGVSVLRGDSVTNFAAGDELPSGSVFALAEDSAHAIWAAGDGLLARYTAGHWHPVGAEFGMPTLGYTTSLLVDRLGAVWVSNDSGVYVERKGAARFERVHAPLDWRQIGLLAALPSGGVWAATTRGGITTLVPDDDGRTVQRAGLPINNASPIFVDRSGVLWATGDSGIFRLTVPSSATHLFKRLDQLSNPVVTTFLQDREGTIWVGTYQGLDRFRRTKLSVVHVPKGSYGFGVVADDNGAVLVGSDNPRVFEIGGQGVRVPDLPHGGTQCMYRAWDGDLWIGGVGVVLHSVGGRFERVPWPDNTPKQEVQSIAKDRSGVVWLSVAGGGGIFRLTNGAWVKNAGRADLPPAPAHLIVADDKGRLWLAQSHDSLVVLERDSVRVLTSGDGLAVGTILAIVSDSDRVLVGGEGGLQYRARGRFVRVEGVDNETFRGVSGIIRTSDGDLWVAGTSGISHIAAAELSHAMRDSTYRVRFERLDFRDGLDGNPAQTRPLPSAIEGTDGRLWFATTAGVYWIDPHAVRRNRIPPPVIVQSLTANGAAYQPSLALALPPRTTNLQIDYTATSLAIPERVQFRYRLDGVDTSWQDVGTRRQAYYTSLPPGSYRFRVIASNDDGLWNDEGATLTFGVPPTFTQTKAFLVLCLLLAAGVVWLLNQYRLRQMARGMQARFNAALAERTRIAQELHDTLLQSFIGINLQLVAMRRTHPDQSDRTAGTLSRLIELSETTLKDARYMVWDMRAPGNLELAAAVNAVARTAVADTDIRLEFAVHGEQRRLGFDVEGAALRICREAVTNAVRHADASVITIELVYETSAFRLRVCDDGRGFVERDVDNAVATGHLGVEGMRMRARQCGGTLAIGARDGQGTAVVLNVDSRAVR